MDDSDWYKAELCGRVGLVPANYIKMEKHDWYKGKMSRKDAVDFLMKTHASGEPLYAEGAFVIRDCQSDQDQFSLTVKHGDDCQHFKIMCNAEGAYYLWPNKTFPSINKLIDFHRTTSVAREPHIQIFLRDLQQTSASKMFEALHDFSSMEEGELNFKKGDRIRLLEKTDENWWTGVVVGTNQEGLFPINYVKELKSH